MHFENLLASAEVRAIDDDLTVEAAGAQQRGIQHVGAIGRRDEDHARILIEAVHLNQQLVERLLTLIMTAAEARAALTADLIDFVDKDDTRRRLLRLIEKVADARGTDTDEHLDEVGTRDRKERNARFARDRSREKRL